MATMGAMGETATERMMLFIESGRICARLNGESPCCLGALFPFVSIAAFDGFSGLVAGIDFGVFRSCMTLASLLKPVAIHFEIFVSSR